MSDEKLLAEIYYVAKRDSGVLISKEMFPCLSEWYAKHIFSLPVNNALAERQVNIVSLYLDPNMSKESNQASQLFVRNAVYEKVSKSNNLRTTASGRKLYLQKINNYSKKVTNQLICEAKGNVCDQKLGIADHPAPLKPSDVSKERWDNLKECKDAQEVIEEYKNRGDQVAIFHSKKNKQFEAERTFKPTISEDIWSEESVPSLRVICAAKIRSYGQEISLNELPLECQLLVKCVPKLINTDSQIADSVVSEQSTSKRNAERTSPSWMLNVSGQDNSFENEQNLSSV